MNPDQKPDDAEHPEQNPQPLDYQRRGDEAYKTKTPLGMQVMAGFCAWILGLVFIVQAGRDRAWGLPFIDSHNALACAIAAATVGTGALAIWLRLRFRWRGFLPGLLLGFGLTCLVPIGILLIICGHR